jgi:hypothetical protein
MKNLLSVIFFLSLFFCTACLSAQTLHEKNSKPEKVYNGPTGHGLGAVISSSNGKGLAYRYWPRQFGFHVAFFPASTNTNKYYNGGITTYLKIREYEKGNLFLHVGLEYQYTSRQYSTYIYPGPSTEYTNTSSGFNFGAGPGFELRSDFVSMDFFLGYGVYNRINTSTDASQRLADETTITLTGGVAVFLEL